MLKKIESEGKLKSYCKGANAAGRWFFQFYSTEFINDLIDCITAVLDLTQEDGPVLEVMSGDGRLTEFLQGFLSREVIATDSKNGRYNIAYPKWVKKLEALEAVKKYSPAFIVMSWEPYLSMVSQELVTTDIPFAWIGQPGKCGHPDLFIHTHQRVGSCFALGKFDSFSDDDFKTDIYLFNNE